MRTLVFILLLIGLFDSGQAQPFGRTDYQKTERYLTMRDGTRLHTTFYTPRGKGQYPVLICRSPYGSRPYGADTLPAEIMYNPDLVAAGYIFVHQDMRGRWMSEGSFENMKPPYSLSNAQATDELTDTWDTFEWIAKNQTQYNGRIGIYGNSYRGWTALVAGVSQHPHLKAVLAMAPVTDFFFEDFYRYGIFSLAYMPVMDVFGVQKAKPEQSYWYDLAHKPFVLDPETGLMADYYEFFNQRKALSNFADVLHPDNFFWREFVEHPHYDAFRQQRNWLQYLHRIQCPTLVVGGWNDEQNLYGILNAYQTLAQQRPQLRPQLVLGPWTHGAPQNRDSLYYQGDHFYGTHLSRDYQQNIELPYFEYHLKGKGQAPSFATRVMDMGKRQWIETQPGQRRPTQRKRFYLGPNERLTAKPDTGSRGYLSDPARPVPSVEEHNFEWMPPKQYTNDDQRFAATRPDVLVFKTNAFDTATCIDGSIEIQIEFASDHPDADLFVKLIDQYPDTRAPQTTDLPGPKMNGYQELVRLALLRARYREGFEQAIPLRPNRKTSLRIPALPVLHTFGAGHRLVVQVQSSHFPLYEMNPQRWIENPFRATLPDFEAAQHRVYHDSYIELPLR